MITSWHRVKNQKARNIEKEGKREPEKRMHRGTHWPTRLDYIKKWGGGKGNLVGKDCRITSTDRGGP